MDMGRMLDHNDWANAEVLRACAGLADEQLDATPWRGQWSIRENLVHMVHAQDGYVELLARAKTRLQKPAWSELAARAEASGRRLREIAAAGLDDEPIESASGYRFRPWVVLLQAIHHTIEHRKQVAALMRAQGIEPPALDGWGYGEATGDVVKVP